MMNVMRRNIFLMTVVLAGCTREPDSAIVRRVQAAGAGNVRTASNDVLLDWFRKHQEVGQEIRKLCEPIRKNAPATWADRVCQGAQAAAAFYVKPRPSDGVGFVPGK
jgi:hypothetical protein